MKFSIIVPIYKVEKYLDKCIESILAQTYTDFELILVDDGSPDNCPKICDDWAQKDSRIVVIHQENAGVSVARNSALKIMKGEYLLFVDGDDYIDKNLLQICYDNFSQKDVDCLIFDAVRVDEKGEKLGEPFYKNSYQRRNYTFSLEQEKYKFYCNEFWTKYEIWARCYKTDIIRQNGIYFPKGVVVAEDYLWALQYLMHTTSCYYIDFLGYYYVKRENSAIDKSRSYINAESGGKITWLLYNFFVENELEYCLSHFDRFADDVLLELAFFPIEHTEITYNLPNTTIINGIKITENKKFIKKIVNLLHKKIKKTVVYNECREFQYLVAFNKINFLYYALDQNKAKLLKRYKCLKLKMKFLKNKSRAIRFVKNGFKRKRN